MRIPLAVVVAVASGGCITVEPPSVAKTYAEYSAARHEKREEAPLPNHRFRTNEPDDAAERARAALVQQCGALDAEASSASALVSTWQRTDYRTSLQRYYVRCSVTVQPNPQDDSADVAVLFDVAACNRLKATEDGVKRNVLGSADVARECSKLGHAPSARMAEDLGRRSERIRQDVFRR
jgi:hypothetical protein